MIGHRLRHRVTLESRVISRDSNGDRVSVWVPVTGAALMPAEVLTGPGREALAAGQLQSDVAARITVRKCAAVASPHGMRLWHGQDLYHIATFFDDATGTRWRTLVCTTGTRDE